jgi:hypothetical protein
MKTIIKILFALALLSPLALAAAQENPKPVMIGSTTWETNFQTLTLAQEGAFISGTYAYHGGKVIGAIANGVIYGYWWEDDDTPGCGPDRAWCGPFVLYLSADRQSFKGFYDKFSRGIARISQITNPKWQWNGTLTAGNIAPNP